MAQPEEATTPPQEVENVPEIGEALVLHKVLLKLVKEVTDQTQWKFLFRTICKSRGRYKDKVVCDIMPMDVCHILLGRPWQYDRKVTHDGVTNYYKFVKDGIKHTLVEDSEIGYAVVKKAKTVLLHTKVIDLPIGIQQMLEEFTDIVVDDLPDKLPPRRSISHHIDFIPRASLPKRAAYRMSTKDNEEIRK
eukprot:PITA_11359